MRFQILAPFALALLSSAASAAPAPVLTDPQAAQLRSACEDVVAKTTLAHSRAGILITTLDGKLVYQHDADELLNPASNVKLFTAATALMKLGPEYRWTTDFLLREPIKPNGEVKDLYVRGNGDPLLTTEKLYGIAGALYHQGIRRITGTIYVDDTYFDDERVGPGFDQETSDRAYMAPTGAVSLNWNAIEIDVGPGATVGSRGRVELEPASGFFQLTNSTTTVRERDRGRVQPKVSMLGEKQKIEVRGRLPLNHPVAQLWRKVDRPDLYFGYTLQALLAQRGIKARGRVRHGATPNDAKVFYSYQGEPLALAVRKMDKVSSNFIAEQLVKTLGAELRGVPGSWPKGVDAIEDFLEHEVGIPRGTYVMKNGSGLNDTNRFSAAQIVKILGYMHQRFGTAPEYLASLGIVGKDGTVHSRMEGTDAVGRIRAKTGTLQSVSALSGIAESVSGQRFLFAILVNDYPGKHAQIVSAMDGLGVAMADAATASGPDQAARQLIAQGPTSSPTDELSARVATYLSLGKLHDKHNLPFLRTALRTERDPALKAVVAEVLYLSDPGDSSGARAVLDAWSASPEVFGRLKAASHELGGSAPVVGALLDIAADGNSEALARTLELAPLAQGDVSLTQEMTDGLEQISRTAPEELLAAFHAAPAETARQAMDFLVQGIASATEPENPFPKALAQAESSKDSDLSAYAKGLEEEFVTKLALARAAPRVTGPTTVSTLPAPAPAATPSPVPAQKPGG